MDLGKLFKDAWGLFIKDIGQLIVGLLLAGVISGGGAVVIMVLVMLLSLLGLETASDGKVTGLGVASIVAIGVGCVAVIALILLVAIPLYAGVLMGALRRVREGRVMSYWDLFTGFHVFGRVVGAYLLAYLLVPLAVAAAPAVVITLGAVTASIPVLVVGALLAVGAMLVLAYLTVCWTYALVVVIDRGVGAREALRESRTLVHGIGWWWTFLALFLLQLVMMAVALAAGMIPFAGMAASLFTAPFTLTFLLAMYFQTRHEDWLIDAAVAAADVAPAAPFAPGPPPQSPGDVAKEPPRRREADIPTGRNT